MDLLVRGLAVWRISTMLVNEDGPGSLLTQLRGNTGIKYLWNTETKHWDVISYPKWNPLHCVYCTSIWVGLVIAILPRWFSLPFALSAIGGLIEDGTDEWL